MFDLIPWRRRERETAPATSPWLFRREFDDLIERFFGEEPLARHGVFGRAFSPVVDITENDNDIIVRAEIPGMEQKDLDVNLAGDVLTIKGEKKAEHEEKGENFHRIERSYGSFSRTFALPCEVQEDKVEASYKNGILSLKLPKSETCKKESVKITVH
jgi:HSP20 family protein